MDINQKKLSFALKNYLTDNQCVFTVTYH